MSDPKETLAGLRLEEGGTVLLAPAVEVTLYFDLAPQEVLRAVADAMMEALDGALTHYATGAMKSFAARSAKSADAFATLFDRPRPNVLKWIKFRATGSGTSAASLDIHYTHHAPLPEDPEARAKMIEDQRVMYEEKGAIFMPKVTSMRATFPLDHPLADPAALLDWVKGLDGVATPAFVSGHAGYAITIFEETGSRAAREAMSRLQAAALSRHPGLDYENYGTIGMKLLKHRSDHPWFWPRIKRAQWLTLVRTEMLDGLCGGRDAVEADVCGQFGVLCHDLGPDGMIFQAGEAPALGNLPEGEDLPAYRRVAQALSAARLPEHKGTGNIFAHALAQAWLEAFEHDHD